MLRKIVKKFFTLLNMIFYRVDYVDFDKFPLQGPAIIVANHQHTFDVSVIHCKSKAWVNWVAKKELTDIPALGKLILKMGVMPVDRTKSDLSVAKSMYAKIRNNEIIALFPQGTRIKKEGDMERIVPKTGAVHIALRTKTPVIPVGVKGDFKLFSKVRVVVGDPVDFSIIPESIPGNDELMRQTIYTMTKIYELIGIEYHLSPEAIEKELLHSNKKRDQDEKAVERNEN